MLPSILSPLNCILTQKHALNYSFGNKSLKKNFFGVLQILIQSKQTLIFKMFKTISWKLIKNSRKTFVRFRHINPLSPYPCDFSKVEKVTVCGASTALGQYLAYMLKKEDIIKEIALHDEGNVRGLALDLEHMNTMPKVRPYSGDFALKSALRHSDIVIITNGMEASLNENDCECIRCNGAMIYKYGVKIASICPEALVCIITPPVNIMVPIFSEVMTACGVYDPKKIFGVCSVMEMRANTIVADYLGLDPATVQVPVIGGATPSSIVPLLSHAKPYNGFTDAEIRQLVGCILKVPHECKKYNTTAPMSTAYAVCRFVLTLSAGLCNECAVLTSFVRANVLPQVRYFASSIRTSVRGAVENYGIPKIHDYELNLVSQASVVLEQDEKMACSLFSELHGETRKEEIEEIRKPRKPFIIKTPCPPYPPCLPTDVCQEKLPEDPCAPSKDKAFNFFP